MIWRASGAMLLVCLPAAWCFGIGVDIDPEILLRGDSNSDSTVDLSDATTITNFLFLGGGAPPCMNQADVDNDGQVTLNDVIYLTNYLYQGGPAPAPVFFPLGGSCGVDDTPTGCAQVPCS